MRYLGPSRVGDAAQSARRDEHGVEAVRPDQHGRDPAVVELYGVQQTAGRAAASVTVREDDGVAAVDVAPFLEAHDAPGVVEATLRTRDAVLLTQDLLHFVEQRVGVDLHVRPQADARAL